MKNHSLWFTLWSHGGIFQQNEFIGELFIPLEFHKFEGSLQEVSYTLSDYTAPETVPKHKHRRGTIYKIHTEGVGDDTEELFDSSSDFASLGQVTPSQGNLSMSVSLSSEVEYTEQKKYLYARLCTNYLPYGFITE